MWVMWTETRLAFYANHVDFIVSDNFSSIPCNQWGKVDSLVHVKQYHLFEEIHIYLSFHGKLNIFTLRKLHNLLAELLIRCKDTH